MADPLNHRDLLPSAGSALHAGLTHSLLCGSTTADAGWRRNESPPVDPDARGPAPLGRSENMAGRHQQRRS
ncbi:unnamed protein product [Merluccius merluccius]